MVAVVLPSFRNFLDIGTKLALFLLSCVTISFVFWCLASGFIRDLSASIQRLSSLTKSMSFFMRGILPTLIRPLEDSDKIPPGSESSLIDIMLSDEYTTNKSPKELNGKGTRLLIESGMAGIIDSHSNSLIQKLESENLKTLLDVQQKSLCLLRRLDDERALIHIKNYLYNNPDKCLNEILFVGSLYLRNLYRDSHSTVFIN